MKLSQRGLKLTAALLFVALWSGWWGQISQDNVLLAAELQPLGKTHGKQGWGPEPGGVIYDGTYPPPYLYHPQWPGYFPPPYFIYPPHYEPNKPWYREEGPTPAGRLVLMVDPLQAQVLVNGYPLQRHPDLSYDVGLLQGEYQVEVTAEGFVPYTRSVEIRGGDRIHLNIRLEKEPGR